jgi:hypothetical protein
MAHANGNVLLFLCELRHLSHYNGGLIVNHKRGRHKRIIFIFVVQNNVMAMTTTTLTQQLAETSAAVSLEQQKHNRIISNRVFVEAISAMQGPDLDENTLWWMVQWGNEYLARFKRDATPARKKAHDEYKKWTAHTKQKQMALFTASLRSAAGGDDSLNQSQND